MQFSDRHTAGHLLGKALARFAKLPNSVVLAIPRGGVVIGQEVARILELPLDIIITKKIGAPGSSEYAIGSVSSTGQVMVDESTLHALGVDVEDLRTDIEAVKQLVARRSEQLRQQTKPIRLQGKTVVLVDDGIATGHTMHAAIASLRNEGVARIILGAPVASEESIRFLEPLVDEIEVLHLPVLFHAVGQFYEDFSEVTDTTVMQLLDQ